MASIDSWLQRCITCRYAVLGKTLRDTECKSKSCTYVSVYDPPSLDELQSRGVYKCASCHKTFSKDQMCAESFWVFDANKYCIPCMENYKAAYYEAKSFRDSFSKIKIGGNNNE